jgi:hypothetical protein
MTPFKPTMDEMHRMDPAKVISYDGRRPMQVNEIIQHLNRDDWPAETEQTTPQPENSK